MMNFKKLIFAIVIMASIFLTACSKQDSPDTKQITKEYKLGVINLLTGPQSFIGEEINNALILANELDNQNSKEKINLVIEDSQDDPKIAISAYNKLKTEEVPIIISVGDQVNSVLSPLANNDKVVLNMTLTASDQTFGEYAFRTFSSVKEQAKAIGDYAKSDLGLKKIAMIYIDNVLGETYKKVLVGLNDFEFSSIESYGFLDKDVKTQILKTIEENPEAIVVTGFGPAHALVFKQLREFDWQGITLSDSSLSAPFVLNGIGLENLDNTYFTGPSFDFENPGSQKMKNFIDKYTEKFKKEPSYVGAFAFDAYDISSSAIRNCKYNGEAIKKCLEEFESEGIMGSMKFINHEIKVPLYIRKVDSGEIVVKKIMD